MMIFAVFLALLTSADICIGKQASEQCIAANSTLQDDAACYSAYQGFLFGVVDQNAFDLVCKEGTCRSEILEYQTSCAGIEEVRTCSTYRGSYCSYIATVAIRIDVEFKCTARWHGTIRYELYTKLCCYTTLQVGP